MITAKKARKILGNKYQTSKEEEIQDIIDSFYSLAEIIAENISSGSKMGSKGYCIKEEE